MEPVHIETDPKCRPVQQKCRPIPIHYKEKFREYLEELKEEGVISGLLRSDCALGWIHNVVISQKNWDKEKIRVMLDTRPMVEAVKTSMFLIPTQSELRHSFLGVDRFRKLDMTHSFHQFAMDEESENLFVFYTPWGLY